MNCVDSPCRHATCPAFPSARCEDDYCGGCFARFYVENEEVNCKLDESMWWKIFLV